MPVFSLLEKLDFTGKKVMALMTHEGSGLGHSELDLRKVCKGAYFGNSIAIHGGDALKAYKAIEIWAKQNISDEK